MKKQQTTEQMVLTALILSLVLITTMSIRLPSPFTQGYVHLGDTMIFLSVMLLGKTKAPWQPDWGPGWRMFWVDIPLTRRGLW